jgi:acyl carrier protein
MDLEADLGIDSIKRVEILSTVQERHPNLPEPDAARAAAARTLTEVLALFPASQAATARPTPDLVAAAIANGVATPVPPALSSDDLKSTVKRIVAEKTGYPEEAIESDMDLEADHGIDSIKRVEILSALASALPNKPEPDPARAAAARTLNEVMTLFPLGSKEDTHRGIV